MPLNARIRVRIPDRSVKRLRVQVGAGSVFADQCVATGEQFELGDPRILYLRGFRPVAPVGYRKDAREYLLVGVAFQIRPHLRIEASRGLNIAYRFAVTQNGPNDLNSPRQLVNCLGE